MLDKLKKIFNGEEDIKNPFAAKKQKLATIVEDSPIDLFPDEEKEI